MDEPYSTLEEYAELLRIACENPRRIEAHTCEYCREMLLEIPEDSNPPMVDKDTHVSLRISLPKSVWEFGGRKDCPLSESLPNFSNGKSDDSSLSVTAHITRTNKEVSTGFLTNLKYKARRQQNELDHLEVVNLVCDEEFTTIPWRLPRLEWMPSVGTRKHFEHVRAMLQECNDAHLNCLRQPNQFKPRRLVVVPIDKRSSNIRIVETAELETAQWCALSYCWGGPQRERAIQGDFDNAKREKLVAIASLPKTVLDAVLVAFELNIPYLWVDALCILQDNLEDLSRELATMSQVYNRATLVITASKASSSTEGFLTPRPQPFKHNEFIVRARYRKRGGTSGTILLELNRVLPYTEPIDYRAWALQESILAYRQVRFENSGICWHCPSNICTGVSCIKSTFVGDFGLLKEKGQELWENLVHDYCTRALSHSSDRLLALSAVAANFQNQEPNNQYLAGLWKDHLPSSLFWHFLEDESSHRPKDYRAPSWSWASVDTNNWFTRGFDNAEQVSRWQSRSSPHRKLEVIDAFTEPAISHLPFGNARCGLLVFRAPSLHLLLGREPSSDGRDHIEGNYLIKATHERSLRYVHDYIAATGIEIFLDAPEDDFEGWGGDDEYEVFMPQVCTFDGFNACYLLLQFLCSEERYQRVGLVQVDTHKQGEDLGLDHFCSLEPDIPNQLFTVV